MRAKVEAPRPFHDAASDRRSSDSLDIRTGKTTSLRVRLLALTRPPRATGEAFRAGSAGDTSFRRRVCDPTLFMALFLAISTSLFLTHLSGVEAPPMVVHVFDQEVQVSPIERLPQDFVDHLAALAESVPPTPPPAIRERVLRFRPVHPMLRQVVEVEVDRLHGLIVDLL